MGKLNEKQLNLIVIGAGVLLSLIFGILCYFDEEEITEINENKKTEENKIRQLLANKRDIQKNKRQLYKLQANFDTLKKLLPDQKKILEFYAIMDQFRLEHRIASFDDIRKVDRTTLGKEGETKSAKAKPKSTGPFIEDEYVLGFQGDYNQVGELINKAERFDRFFSLKAVKISPLRKNKDDKEKRSTVQLKMVTFSFEGQQGKALEENLAKYLKGFTPDTTLEEEIRKRKQELEHTQTSFVWHKIQRNPLDQDQVITPEPEKGTEPAETSKDKKDEVEVDPFGPTENDKSIEEKFQDLWQERNYLHLLASAGNWTELQIALGTNKYERKIQTVVVSLTNDNDPKGETRSKLNEMHAELQEWKTKIDEVRHEQQAKDLLTKADEILKDMRAKYNEAKRKGDQKLLENIRTQHNAIMPRLIEFADMYAKVPGLQEVKLEIEKLYKKADTQIKIINLAQKLDLQGIIYWAEKPEASVAFINKKAVHQNEALDLGFVIHKIHEGEVVLSYEGETVPLRLKRGFKKITEKTP